MRHGRDPAGREVVARDPDAGSRSGFRRRPDGGRRALSFRLETDLLAPGVPDGLPTGVDLRHPRDSRPVHEVGDAVAEARAQSGETGVESREEEGTTLTHRSMLRCIHSGPVDPLGREPWATIAESPLPMVRKLPIVAAATTHPLRTIGDIRDGRGSDRRPAVPFYPMRRMRGSDRHEVPLRRQGWYDPTLRERRRDRRREVFRGGPKPGRPDSPRYASRPDPRR